jgi:hypothetical protein
MPPSLIKSIDGWAANNADGSRSEAIRRLVELGLAGAAAVKQTGPKAPKATGAHHIGKRNPNN